MKGETLSCYYPAKQRKGRVSCSKNIQASSLWGRKDKERKYPSSPLQNAQSLPWLLLSWACYITPTGTLSMLVLYGIQLWKQGEKKTSLLWGMHTSALPVTDEAQYCVWLASFPVTNVWRYSNQFSLWNPAEDKQSTKAQQNLSQG